MDQNHRLVTPHSYLILTQLDIWALYKLLLMTDASGETTEVQWYQFTADHHRFAVV